MNRFRKHQFARKYSKPISLYPLSPDEALRAALQTPPEKKRAVRAGMGTPQGKVEISKEEIESRGRSRKESRNAKK
jgi:hypothetical protein